jgi:hypothetical protein
MAGSLVHVSRVPEGDGGNDEIERHGAFLLGGIRAIADPWVRPNKGTWGDIANCLYA